tara:strand:- start:247 stop:882 length:636 start_codon:yes stop_codon:yes gene_type:complete
MTAKIKLNAASGGGSISIQAPSSSSNNRIISLPDIADGTLLTSQSSLDSTKLSPAISGGKFSSYAIIADQKATDTNGGSTSTGTFNVRDLNTELVDDDNIVSISSNQFTLQAGTYLIRASAPAYKAARHQIILWNATDSSLAQVGTSEFSEVSSNICTRSFVQGRATIGAAKAFEIRHRVGNAVTTFGFGVASNYDLLASIYTIVEIYKES